MHPSSTDTFQYYADQQSTDEVPLLHREVEANSVKYVKEQIKQVDQEYVNNTYDYKGNLAIHVACMFSNPEIISALLKAGADPNKRQKKVRDIAKVPLSLAVSRSNSPAVALLLEYGAARTALNDFDGEERSMFFDILETADPLIFQKILPYVKNYHLTDSQGFTVFLRFFEYKFEQQQFDKLCYAVDFLDVHPDDLKTKITAEENTRLLYGVVQFYSSFFSHGRGVDELESAKNSRNMIKFLLQRGAEPLNALELETLRKDYPKVNIENELEQIKAEADQEKGKEIASIRETMKAMQVAVKIPRESIVKVGVSEARLSYPFMTDPAYFYSIPSKELSQLKKIRHDWFTTIFSIVTNCTKPSKEDENPCPIKILPYELRWKVVEYAMNVLTIRTLLIQLEQKNLNNDTTDLCLRLKH